MTKNYLFAGLLAVGLAFSTRTIVEAAPLSVLSSNPRYFTNGGGNAVYLTGSHTWGQWADGFDFNAYLNFLDSYNHNYIRVWSGDHGLGSSPSPYVLSGGKADLDNLNAAFFQRIRDVAMAAGNRGKYVGINMFPMSGNKIADGDVSFFKLSNNIQGVNGDPNGDGIGYEAYNLSIPQITAYQEAYARKMVDTLNDLDNIIYEIGNEGDNTSISWQYYFINYIKNYQANKPKQHPVGMSATLDWQGGSFNNDNGALFNSPADWIAPGGSTYIDDMPAANGNKVILLDSDHIASVRPGWIWKSFTRGLQPNVMDWYNNGSPPQFWYTIAEQDEMRKMMGQTLSYASKMNLASMSPSTSLCSTAYCLVNPGSEYLVYQPNSGAFTVNLQSGNYSYEWFNPSSASMSGTGNVTAGGGNQSFTPPFSGAAVLYLKFGGSTPTPTPNITPTPSSSCLS